MAVISYVTTISRVAEILGESEDTLQELAIYMEPEDGRLRVRGIGEDSVTAFTDGGIDYLHELLLELKKGNIKI
jgi:hypothetical protein